MAKKIVRVHFVDENVKSFAIDETDTAEMLRALVADRIELKEDACFAIFERKDGWDRCLDPDEKPCELMTLWNADPKTNCRFIFKKKIFLREDDREMQDPKAKSLLYIQALHSVIESEYPCSVEDAIKLAGLQVQIVYGDHNPKSHVIGFLTNNLKQFVPKDIIAAKKPQEWETLIFKAHQTHSGKSPDEAMTEYLEVVKQWPFYGTTFYPPCKSLATSRRLPNRVIIGVNAEGILLLKKDKELISTHPFTEICSWASSSSTFAFEFGSQTEAQKYTFETKQGAIIAATVQTYIDILVQMLKSGDDDDDDDEQN